MTLREGRIQFTKLIPRLIDKAFELGFEAALDEGTERLTTKDPTSDHMSGSLHHIGLAVDLLLYKGSIWQTDSEEYRKLGMYWESLDMSCHWGGFFGDGNHFSFSNPSIPGCVNSQGFLRK